MMENVVKLIGVLYGILIICTLPGSHVDGALDVKPVDTAVLDGQSAVLRCHSDLGTSAAVGWTRRVVGEANKTIIVVACDILPALKPTLSSVYSLISDGPGQCDLVVNRTDTSLTGLYICTEGTNTAEAQLTIIDEDVHMSQSPDFVLEGDKLKISCEVGYSGILAPVFAWRPTLNNIPPVVDTGSSVNSTVQVTVPSFPGSVPRYTCYVMFSGLFFPSSANQTSTPVKTSVCVKTATISGVTNGSVVDAGTVISCSADVNAFPLASYRWINHVDNSQSAGPQFVTQADTEYKLTCIASNNVGRCNNATVYVEFNTTGVPPTTAEPSQPPPLPGSSTRTAPSGASSLSPSPRPESEKDNLPLIIGLSVGIGVLVILIIILLLCCCCERCPWYRKKCCNKPKAERYQAGPSEASSADGRDRGVRMTNMGYEDSPSDPYRPDILRDNQPPSQDYSYSSDDKNDGTVYAQLQVPAQPRSRTPVVEPSNTVYGNVEWA